MTLHVWQTLPSSETLPSRQADSITPLSSAGFAPRDQIQFDFPPSGRLLHREW
jgi:hypothetical protein